MNGAQTAERLWRRAQVCRANGRLREALAALIELAGRWPTVEVYTALAQTAQELEDHSLAYAAYRRALEKDGLHLPALMGLAALHRAQGRETDAADVYTWALKHHPNVPEVHLNLGVSLARLGHTDEAELCFWNALRLVGKDAPLTGTILYNLARLYATIEHHAAAISFLLAAASRDTGFALRACLDDVFLDTSEEPEFRKVIVLATPQLLRQLSALVVREGDEALRRFLRERPILDRAVRSERPFALLRRHLS
ncbi:MAG: hypothetical protein KatS3mg115_1047 [Candidatus Poribacteria bacterium]|nr:MAG: hypothetical protein KatS3mg115_1047 [Candidatus Poribacteria bacterium]